jgi:predicted transcriptional regulator
MSRTIPIRVPEEIFDAIEAISQRTEHTRSYVGRRLLEEGLKGELFGSAVKPKRASIKTAMRIVESVEVPPCIPADAWLEWDQYRAKRSGKAWTAHAKVLCIARLEAFWHQGYDPAVIIRASIENGWSGLFAPKDLAVGNREDLARRVQPIVESSAEEMF